MPTNQPRPVLTLNGIIRGDVERFDSRPDSNGVVEHRGRVKILTDEGGFIDVSIPESDVAMVESLPKSAPVAWLVEVGAWKRPYSTGTGDDRRAMTDANGHPVVSADLACTLVRPVEAAAASRPLRAAN